MRIDLKMNVKDYELSIAELILLGLIFVRTKYRRRVYSLTPHQSLDFPK